MDKTGFFEAKLDQVLKELRTMLIEKNKAYGDSVSNPIRIFSKADAKEQLYVRIDDKLSRLMRGDQSKDLEDVKLDLLGYLIIDRITDIK